MSGRRVLLDTNAIVALLRGDEALLHPLEMADWVGISVISQIEFLAFTGLTDPDRVAFRKFLSRVVVVGLDAEQPTLVRLIVRTRKEYRLKVPDAIIAATALWCGAQLATQDREFERIAKLKLLAWR